ncbi:MAG: phosphatidylglycerol---prolipoprotein diacylglyceryl transferase [Chloroflexota bacterium]|jgi:phosphatidylglycerol:prolipoprotein diacylglycerol transferase|nr:phosphatidylglycerol---prolipoprotein diacylglyceryl transferase [Chloroflexota bacterium]
MIDITPDPVAVQLGPVPISWYGLCYALGLLVVYQIMIREARRKGLDPELIINGLIVVAVAALIGGRLYHVIDQWALYKDDPLTILLPIRRGPDGSYGFAGFSGLGVYGGLLTGPIAAWLYLRWKGQSFWRWADVVAPGLFAMQAVGRLGNFFNQELYGPPTDLPWGIAIQCKHRVAPYLCPDGSDPNATLGQHFQPLFLYESVSAIVGLLFLLWLGRRYSHRLRPGDLLLIFFVWYGTTRFLLEFMRYGYNWTLGGIPTAQIASGVAIAIALALLVFRHLRPGPTVAQIEADEGARGAAEALDDNPADSDSDSDSDSDRDPPPEDHDAAGSKSTT